MKNNKNFQIIALSFVPFIMVLGNSMLIPIFADLKRELGINQLQANLLISYFSLPGAILIPFLGFLSDRIGRKKILIPSLILYGIGGAISGFAGMISDESYNYILFGRLIQGVGAAGTSPMAMILISNMFSAEERSRALGMIESANGIGKVISPILGSIIALVAWYFVFFSYSVLTIPIAIAVAFLIKDMETYAERKRLSIYFKEIYALLKNKGLSLSLCQIVGFFSLFTLYGILSNLSDIVGEMGSNNAIKRGFYVALPLLTMSVVSYWFGGLIGNKDMLYKKVMIMGLFFTGLGAGIIPFLDTYIYRFIALEIIGIGVGSILTTLNTFVTSCVPPGKRGVVTSVYNSVRFFGISFGPIYFNNFKDTGVKPVIMVIVTLILAIGFYLFVKTNEMLEYYGTK